MNINMNNMCKFKTIFDDLDESIIIVNQHHRIVEYANNQFCHEFQSQILKLFENSIYVSDETRIGWYLRNIKQYFIDLFNIKDN